MANDPNEIIPIPPNQPDPDFTREELMKLRKELRTALFTGAKEVWYGDKKVSYNSALEIKQAIANINNILGEATCAGRKMIIIDYDKGVFGNKHCR